MRKANGMSAAQHQKLGNALRAIRNEIADAINSYPYCKNSREQKALLKLFEVAGRTQSVMDDAVFREYPSLTTKALMAFYYGGGNVK